MEENKIIAEVIQVTEHPIVEVSEGVKTGGFTVHAKIVAPADKFSTGLYYVRILEPVAFGHFQHDQGSLMEDGQFSFEVADEVNVKDKLELSVTPAAG